MRFKVLAGGVVAAALMSGSTDAATVVTENCTEVSYSKVECLYATTDIRTTADDPDFSITFTPIVPTDLESWTLDYFYARVGAGTANYVATYDYEGPAPGPLAYATLAEFSILDGSGSPIFANSPRYLLELCGYRPNGKWVCSDGNSAGSPVGLTIGPAASESEKAAALELLKGSFTVNVKWETYYEGEPESFNMLVGSGGQRGIGYSLTRIRPAVPEPGAALLYATGVALFAIVRRSRR